MKVVIDCLFWKPEVLDIVRGNDELMDAYEQDPANFYHQKILIELDDISSALPSYNFKKSYTTVRMKEGSEYTVKMSSLNFYQMVDYVLAEKILCRINN